MLVNDFSAELNKENGYMQELSRSGYTGDKTNLYKQIDILHQAIEKTDEVAVDRQIALIDTEFQNIALITNSNLASDKQKKDQEIAAKAAADAKAMADAAKTLKTDKCFFKRI